MVTKSRVRQLLVGTALTIPMAMGSAQAQAQDESICAELEQYLEGDMPERIGRTQDELRSVIEANDIEQCQVLSVELRKVQTDTQDGESATDQNQDQAQVVDRERARITLEDEVFIEGEVLVNQNPPRVAIESGETEVNVRNATPDVTVREQQGEILVRQAPATIRVEMPQPTITIEQPAPEIIVTMPAPGVDVASARPEIEVRQAEPRVSVSQTPPDIELNLSRAEDNESSQGIAVRDRATGNEMTAGQEIEMPDAEVSMSSSEPLVTYQDSEQQQANVQFERAEPTIRYESAEPNIEFSQSGEPQVQYSQTGETQVTFRDTAEADSEPAEAQAAAEMDAPEVEAQAEAPVAEEQPTAEPVELEGAEIETTEGATEPEVDAAVVPEVEPETNMADTAFVGPEIAREGYRMTSVAEVDVESLTGSTVYDVNDETVGEVGDLIMNADGQVQDAIIDVGGFLGLGEKPVLVSFNELTLMQSEAGDDLRVYIDRTEDQLEDMEAYIRVISDLFRRRKPPFGAASFVSAQSGLGVRPIPRDGYRRRAPERPAPLRRRHARAGRQVRASCHRRRRSTRASSPASASALS